MSHWNYRIVKCRDEDGGYFYGLYEVFYDDAGNPNSRTEEPIDFVCDEDEGPDGIRASLTLALKDATERPALSDDDLPMLS